MFYSSEPVAVSPDEVWMFLLSDETSGVDAGRLAFCPDCTEFLALATEVFNTSAALPVLRETGEPLGEYRWATTADIDAHASLFTPGGEC
ncbi:hypothetical protein [Prauserella rugosa]|uniref:Uncharacterized protein n=1 Tax=Prauserella rugosa TaxID=43354 RepID=A0A660CCA0_9PSEU|nr:hypothetical protein [Prauserella rugosa]KMS86132.1 hypothetical protein ACZ91_38520 [Streptomyces regensis]TWH18541.1 hypothetical protein JD82_00359 [Prauserella rugosa]